jgi:membrane protease YdiL (CAAX protease family)
LTWNNIVFLEQIPTKVDLWNIIKFAVGAGVIGCLEEIIFRGIIFQLFSKNLNGILSIIVASLFFAYCHFGLENSPKIDSSDITIFSGFRYIIPAVVGLCQKFNLLNFLSLTGFGILLSILLLFAPLHATVE